MNSKTQWLTTNPALIETAVFCMFFGTILFFDDMGAGFREYGNVVFDLANYSSLAFVICGILLMIIISSKKTSIYGWLVAIITIFFISGMWARGYARPSVPHLRPTQTLISIVVGIHFLFMHLGVWTKYIHRKNRDEIEHIEEVEFEKLREMGTK